MSVAVRSALLCEVSESFAEGGRALRARAKDTDPQWGRQGCQARFLTWFPAATDDGPGTLCRDIPVLLGIVPATLLSRSFFRN